MRDFYSHQYFQAAALPVLQDVLCVCDEELLLQALVFDTTAEGSVLGPFREDHFRKKWAYALDTMCMLECREDASSFVFMPKHRYAYCRQRDVVERHTAPVLVDLEDLIPVRVPLPISESLEFSPSSALYGYACRHTCVEDWRESDLLPTYDFTSDLWEETLSHRVWIDPSLCEEDEYAFLAVILKEMTYYGFEYKDVRPKLLRSQICI